MVNVTLSVGQLWLVNEWFSAVKEVNGNNVLVKVHPGQTFLVLGERRPAPMGYSGVWKILTEKGVVFAGATRMKESATLCATFVDE